MKTRATSPGWTHAAWLAAVVLLAAPAADAATLELRCERRADPARSKISVDARNVAPNALFSARVISGTRQVTARPLAAFGDEVEFDFDSDPANIRAGATAIPANFIQGGRVRAAVFNANGQVVAGPGNATCELR